VSPPELIQAGSTGRIYQASPDEVDQLSHFRTKAGKLQRACLALLTEHEEDGAVPTSGRFLFYELEQRGVIPKQYLDDHGRKRARQPSGDVADALTHLRQTGLIPWDWIVDETRTLTSWSYSTTVADYARDAIRYARLDLWAGEPPPLLICESRSLAGVLREVAATYLVPITATNGQVGGHLHTSVAPILTPKRRILYLGDLEPGAAGEQIEDNTRRVLEEYEPLAWERLALTPEQVDRYQLGRLAIEKLDRRYKPPKPYQAIETEALRQQVIVGIVRDRLDALLPEPLDDVQVRERLQRAAVAALLQGQGGSP
jgi:hypothetical protein